LLSEQNRPQPKEREKAHERRFYPAPDPDGDGIISDRRGKKGENPAQHCGAKKRKEGKSMMDCTFCEKQIEDTAEFCRHCNNPVSQGGVFANLVAAARAGDQDAVGALYEKTYSKVYYTVKSMIRDEDAVFDIVQDTYLKAFAHLDRFEGDTKFLPWVRQIAANTARDWLKKKRPMLFAEMGSGEESDAPVEELLPDVRREALPDETLDQEETKRLLREIIDALPEDQRAVIGMFYYEEMSVKQIAAAMDASESAVKSRLMYGRQKIEKKVRELEKQGTKLYNLAPLPFLLLLFRSLKAGAAEAPNAQILQAVLASQPMGAAAAAGAGAGEAAAGTGASGAAGTEMAGTTADGATGAANAGTAAASSTGTAAGAAAGTGAGAAGAGNAVGAGLGALKLGLIALAAVAAVGLGVFAASRPDFGPGAPQGSLPAQGISGREEQRQPDVSGKPETPTNAKVPKELRLIDAALEQYRIILHQAGDYEYGTDSASTGFRYALVQMRPDDPIPALLLEKETESFISGIRVFQYDPETKTVLQPAQTMTEGVAGVGGYRGGLMMAGDGAGVICTEWSSGTGETTITRITLNGDILTHDIIWTGIFDDIPDSISNIAIDWHEIEDLSALESRTAPEPDEAALPGAGGSSALPTDGDRIVLTGTVGTWHIQL